jgi:hypothetical protein
LGVSFYLPRHGKTTGGRGNAWTTTSKGPGVSEVLAGLGGVMEDDLESSGDCVKCITLLSGELSSGKSAVWSNTKLACFGSNWRDLAGLVGEEMSML